MTENQLDAVGIVLAQVNGEWVAQGSCFLFRSDVLALTAAHCVYTPRTGRNLPPGSLHFLIGYDGSRYAGHAIGIKLETGPGYDPIRPYQTRGSDWALISLDTKLGSADRVLPMISEPPEVGSTIMLGGYQQDHPLVLMADTECRIVGRATDAGGRLLLRHNCTGTRGDSGAPLLIEKGGKWYTGGLMWPPNSALPVGSPSSSTKLAAPLTLGPSHRYQIDISPASLR